MSQEVISQIIGQVFEIAIEFALIFWNEILTWVSTNLLVWITKDMIPSLEESLELAFMSSVLIDSKILDTVIKAWREVKNILLEMLVNYENSASSPKNWKKKATSIIIKKIEANQPVVIKREVEEEIDWDHLPSEVRNSWLKKEQKKYKIDVKKTREKELEMLKMTQ